MKRNIFLAGVALLIAPALVAHAQYDGWMTNNHEHLKNKTLRQIILPGSHDAGAGVFLIPYKFADEKPPGPIEETSWVDRLNFLLRRQVNPASPFAQVNPLLAEARKAPQPFIAASIAPFAKTQIRTVGGQLAAGSRYFDLRPFLSENGTIFNTHTLYGQRMRDVFDELKAFLDRNPNEVVVLHERQNGGYMTVNYGGYWQQVVSAIGDRLIESTRSRSTYGEIIRENQKRRIVYVTSFQRPSSPYIWIHGGDVGWPGEGISDSALRIWMDNHFKKEKPATDYFAIASLAYTPLPPAEYGCGIATRKDLKMFHDKFIKSQIVGWLDQWARHSRWGMNVLMTDFIEDNPAFVSKIIELNRSPYPQSTALTQLPTGGPRQLRFANYTIFDVRFVISYRNPSGNTLSQTTAVIPPCGAAELPLSSGDALMNSVIANYKDLVTWKPIGVPGIAGKRAWEARGTYSVFGGGPVAVHVEASN